MAIVNFGPFQLGPNTFWLDLHGMMMFIILVFSAFLFGAIFFAKTADAVLVRRLKISASVSFAALLLLIVSGIIPDIGFTAAALNGTTHNAYGTEEKGREHEDDKHHHPVEVEPEGIGS